MRTRSIVLAATLCFVPVAAACGSDDSDPAPAAGTEAPDTSATSAAPTITPADAMDALAADPDIVVVDVRTPEEYAEGHLPNAVRIGLADPDFADQLLDLDPDASYLVYCRSGNRSAQAAAIMLEMGFTDVQDLGGIGDWQAAGGEVVVTD